MSINKYWFSCLKRAKQRQDRFWLGVQRDPISMCYFNMMFQFLKFINIHVFQGRIIHDLSLLLDLLLLSHHTEDGRCGHS